MHFTWSRAYKKTWKVDLFHLYKIKEETGGEEVDNNLANVVSRNLNP
jgi:hypothetical protein